MDNAGQWKYVIFLVFFSICGNFFTFPSVYAGNSVPVMLWLGESSNSHTNPLQKTAKIDFEEILHKRLGRKTPPLILFVKDSLCIEDIKEHKNLQHLNDAGSLTFLTSVDSPLEVFEDLKQTYILSYPTEDNLVPVNEGQLAILQISDLTIVPKIYNMLKESSPNLKAALTGRVCSFTLHERFKRAATNESSTDDKSMIISNDKVLFYVDKAPVIQIGSTEVKLEMANYIVRDNETGYDLAIDFKDNYKLTVKFRNSSGYFNINGVEYEHENDKFELKNNGDTYFPMKYSYHCQGNTLFRYYKTNKDTSSSTIKKIILKLSNLQVQLNPSNGTFSKEVYDCTGIFSIPILSGIFVTAVLGLIMIWALLMIMDINTNDRFDDPKGKTITVTAQE